jgi:hypothetical protein
MTHAAAPAPDPSRTGREVWTYVDREDPHNSGWWQLARITRWDDGRVTVETNTRGSVISTQVTIPAEAVAGLIAAVDALR